MAESNPNISPSDRTSSPGDEESTTGVVKVAGNVAAVVAKERADQEAKTIHTMRSLRDQITRRERKK
jgi:hypothetical protein